MFKLQEVFKRMFGHPKAPAPEVFPPEVAENVLERPPATKAHKPPPHLWAFERDRLPNELEMDKWNTVY